MLQTSEIIPANANFLIFTHVGHPMKISGSTLATCLNFLHKSTYLLLFFFMSETKEDIFLPANPVPIQNKSPESTGIIWDLHRGVQGTALH